MKADLSTAIIIEQINKRFDDLKTDFNQRFDKLEQRQYESEKEHEENRSLKNKTIGFIAAIVLVVEIVVHGMAKLFDK